MILDTNVFIESKNRYYAFDICPGFWDFIIDDFSKGSAVSINHVRDELLRGNDELTNWIKNCVSKTYFHDCLSDTTVVGKQLMVANYVQSAYSKPNVINDFLNPSVADSWIVAYAMTNGGTVVTHEKTRSKSKKVSLVDVCSNFQVQYMNVFDFLRHEKAKFIY